jgi:RNA polymerase sigma-70 factor (ECF subfamily)
MDEKTSLRFTQKNLTKTFLQKEHTHFTQPMNNKHDWESCYTELAPRLVLYARQLTPSLADAEDVVQAAFVRWWRRFPNADRDHIPLLYAAVRTIALDLHRSNTRRSRRESASTVAQPYLQPGYYDQSAEQQDVAQYLEQALQQLPQEQREVVTLHLWGGLTFAQIADATDTSINTITARYRYALKALQRKLEPHQEELTQPIQAPTLAVMAKPNPTTNSYD